MSFDAGVQALVEILAGRLAEGLHLGAAVRGIARRGGSWAIALEEGGRCTEAEAEIVVLATPAYAAAEIVAACDADLAAALSAIPYAPISVVALGYDRASLGHDLDGFGFLIPRREGRKILGALWDSSVFPNRAPEGKALIRAMVGGARAPELATLPGADLVRLARREIDATMGIAAEPVLARAFVHEKGIPQYRVGHGKVLDRIDARLAANPGLLVNSNAYRGVALNDCVLQSRLCAERVARILPA